MELIRGLHNLNKRIPPCVVTIGNFDGMHLGHQRLIMQLKKQAKEHGLVSVIMTFEPQPNEYFQPNQPPGRLMKFREKWHWLSKCGIDYLFCIRFNAAFSKISAIDFVQELLVNQMKMRMVIVGDDFRFGAKREGNYPLLQKLAKQFNFQIMQLPPLELQGKRVSSSLVRKALHAGDLQLAAKFLGRSYQMCGKVAHGKKIGQTLGFPTANIETHRREVPMTGIFVVRIHGVSGPNGLLGVANLGIRPVFNGTRVLLEVYIFDFCDDLYGKFICVEFLHKLRDEVHFDRVEDLVRQIEQDVLNAKEYFLQQIL